MTQGASGCICVPYYQCQDGNIINDGSGIIDPRNIKPSKKELPLVIDFFLMNQFWYSE